MKKEIPTAEEFLKHRTVFKANGEDDKLFDRVSKTDLIEFAKLHVKATLEAVAEKAVAIEGWNTGFSGSAASVDKESILNAYPEENIK